MLFDSSAYSSSVCAAPCSSSGTTSTRICSVLVREFLSTAPRLKLHRFPGYAPELNPDEFVWSYLKRGVANTVPTDLRHLKRLIHTPLQRLRQSQRLLWACVKASELSWPEIVLLLMRISVSDRAISLLFIKWLFAVFLLRFLLDVVQYLRIGCCLG